MRNRPDWMTNADVLIVVAMGSSDLLRVVSPTVIAFNLGMSRGHVSRRLGEMVDHGFVRKIEDGKYELSDEGREFLHGER